MKYLQIVTELGKLIKIKRKWYLEIDSYYSFNYDEC